MNRLSTTKIKNLKPKNKVYKAFDGDGLYIRVRPSGHKSWYYKFKVNKKEKVVYIDDFPNLLPAEARKKKGQLKAEIKLGIDPTKKLSSNKENTESSTQDLFKTIAEEWYKRRLVPKSECPKHQRVTLRYLEKDLYPDLAERSFQDITTPDLLSVLRKVEDKGKVYTAHRLCSIVGRICRFAKSSGVITNDPSHKLHEALTAHKEKNFASLTEPCDIANLMYDIPNYHGTDHVRLLLTLSPLLLLRPGEVRHLEWNDIFLHGGDFDDIPAYIQIPAERMKLDKPHIIPLSRQAIQILKELKPLSKGQYVFPSIKPGTPCLSENTANRALRAMGYDNSMMTAHGFRAMARTALDERLEYPVDWIEHQLAHTVRDVNGTAYNRTKHLKQRLMMLQDWADYLDWLVDKFTTTQQYGGYESKMQKSLKLLNADLIAMITDTLKDQSKPSVRLC